MQKKMIVIAGCLLLLCTTSTMAQIHLGVGIRIGPPSPVREVVVSRPFRNAVWIPGFYRWHLHRHEYTWVPGHWVRAPRAGAVWIPERWEQRKGEWVCFEGRWKEEHPVAHERRRGK